MNIEIGGQRKMENLFEYERKKYNLIHNFHGIDKNQVGYARQLNELLSNNSQFHTFWRSCIDKKMSFLEVGVGAGEILNFFEKNKINYLGIDISDYAISQLKNEGLKLLQSSSHQIPLDGECFDVVQHLDGLEHIPPIWEFDTLSEEIRVSRKYIFHANAMGDAYLDEISKNNGFNELHINIKSKEEWDLFYKTNSKILNYEIIHSEIINNTYYIILEKNVN